MMLKFQNSHILHTFWVHLWNILVLYLNEDYFGQMSIKCQSFSHIICKLIIVMSNSIVSLRKFFTFFMMTRFAFHTKRGINAIVTKCFNVVQNYMHIILSNYIYHLFGLLIEPILYVHFCNNILKFVKNLWIHIKQHFMLYMLECVIWQYCQNNCLSKWYIKYFQPSQLFRLFFFCDG